MKKNINRTLMEKLFVSPNPLCNKKEFFQMRYRMFGDEKDFIEFLETTETIKKIAVAKKIVYRLAFQSNFAPSLELLDYLAEFESTIRYNRSVNHPSRDHYIHICYLYLLGVYMFFYHPKLNDKLHNSMSLIRHSYYLNEEDNFVKSFLGSWKYFILYHDITYPLEYLWNDEKQYNELEKEAKKRVEDLYMPSQIWEGILDVLALKTLSRINALGIVMKNLSSEAHNLFGYLERNMEQFINLDRSYELEAFIKAKKKDSIAYLQNIESGDDIKVFLSVFGCDDFFVVLKEQSAIKCIIDSSNCFVLEDWKENQSIRKIKENRSLLFQDELFELCPEFRVEYYGINLESGYDKFIYNNRLQAEPLKTLNMDVKSTGNMQEMSFMVFLECYERYKKKEGNIIYKDIGLGCDELLFDELKRIKIKITEDGSEKYKEYAEAYIKKYKKKMRKCLKNLSVDRLAEQAVYKSSNEYQRISTISYFYNAIKKNIDSEPVILSDLKAGDIWELYKVEHFNQIFEMQQEKSKKYVQECLQRATNSEKNIYDILKDYHVEYTRYDHGVTSSMIFMLHFSLYHNIVEECKGNELLCVGFNIPNTIDGKDKEKLIEQKYINDYEKSSGQVMYSILIHNLYPDNFKEIAGIKTSLNTNPFAFFCLLCDALQNWGRPYNINPIKELYPVFIDAEKYNVKLGKYITVKFEEDDPKVIRNYLEPFSEVLDYYLEGASKEIRVVFKR